MNEDLSPYDVAYLKLLLIANGSKRAKEINDKIKNPDIVSAESIQYRSRNGKLMYKDDRKKSK